MSNSKKPFSLGEKIRIARKSRGYSQREFGEALELSDKAVSAYEVDRAEPTLHTLREMSKITHKPIAYFLGEAESDDLEIQIKLKTVEKELLEIKQLLQKRSAR